MGQTLRCGANRNESKFECNGLLTSAERAAQPDERRQPAQDSWRHLRRLFGGEAMAEKTVVLIVGVMVLVCLAGSASYAQTDTEDILHTFVGQDGAVPEGLFFDRAGHMYGTTQMGGSGPCTSPGQGCGEVFEATLVRDAWGAITWQKRVIYEFQGGIDDGAAPMATLVIDGAGNLYGTTTDGGGLEYGSGCGTVFMLHRAGGKWNETVLYKFTCGSDGGSPESPVTLDSAGNIYGTTYNGGLRICNQGFPCGVVYQLQHTESGWVETVIHSFDYADGADPVGGLVRDSAGNLYGVTPFGGQRHLDPYEPTGTIFELSPTASGWSFQVLYRFPAGGGGSYAGLTIDASGNLYGTANVGGVYGLGSVYELQPPIQQGAPWVFSTLVSFNFLEGSGPQAGVVLDKAGNLYGTTGGGGNSGQGCQGTCGLVFELTPSDGYWTENVLYEFQGGTDGTYPNTTPLLDPWGNVYGTTAYGGDPNCIPFPQYSGCGIVYRINHSAPGTEAIN
jgi:hypothetical protein